MIMAHRYAEALRWIADGKTVQIRWGKDPRWMSPEQRNEIVNDEILRGAGDYEFRIKPRTVKIGSREVEAPVLEPVEGSHVHFLNTNSVNYRCEHDSIVYNPKHNPETVEGLRKRGLLFASREASEAFHDALTEMLTGNAT